MKKKIFLAVFLCCGMFAAMAQTAADSLAIVSADWQTEPLQKGMLYKKAVFSSLYGVPQEVSIFEISPKRYRFDVLVHNPKEETSVAARHAGAVAAINGSYFDMKAGNSVCYLRKDGVVIDTTSTGVLATVSCLGGPTITLTLNINPQNIAAIYIQGLIRCQVVIVSCGVEVCSFSGNLFINSFEKLSK